MLFTSPEFLYLFLPLTVAIWWRLQADLHENAAQWFVVLASLFFYAWWNWRFIPILGASVALNFVVGKRLAQNRNRHLLIAGLAFNLGLLAYFKYANFLLDNWDVLFDRHSIPLEIVLPLGISFFTFQKIAFLVDCYQGKVGSFTFRRFAFFVSFFPQLIAGPIVHHADLIPQIQKRAQFDAHLFSRGLFLFATGLFKKTVIADRLAQYVDPLFGVQAPLQTLEAWTAAIGYGLQIYFDFSAYSEMAIGMGMLFGLYLPQNFNSPYQAVNITDFWRRWHMTLSRFLRDYLYIPLGGNRNGFARGITAATVTMILGGLWHGAAWTFAIWGALHATYIAIHRIWIRIGVRMPVLLGGTITWCAVTVAWVMFRANSLDQALSLWSGMAGMNGTALPPLFQAACETCAKSTLITGIETTLFLVLLTVCTNYPSAMMAADKIEPRHAHLARLLATFAGAIFLANSGSAFLYWNF